MCQQRLLLCVTALVTQVSILGGGQAAALLLLFTGISNMGTGNSFRRASSICFYCVPVLVTWVTLLDGGQQHLLLLCTGTGIGNMGNYFRRGPAAFVTFCTGAGICKKSNYFKRGTAAFVIFLYRYW